MFDFDAVGETYGLCHALLSISDHLSYLRFHVALFMK